MSEEITYIYVIGNSNGPIKVGITANLISRLSTIRTGSPTKVSLLFAMPCDSRAHAREHERTFHESFASERLEGEWFDVDAELAINQIKSEFQLDQWSFHRQFYKTHPEYLAS